jgi:hypothetical protein
MEESATTTKRLETSRKGAKFAKLFSFGSAQDKPWRLAFPQSFSGQAFA